MSEEGWHYTTKLRQWMFENVYEDASPAKLEEKKARNVIKELFLLYCDMLKPVCDESKIIFDSIIRKLREVKNVDVLDLQHMARKYIKCGTEEMKVEYYYTEITSKGVDKWGAIEKLAEGLQIDQSEIVAIGDNMNDKEMIENAGLGIIMQNSAPYMKDFADVVVSDNNNDGVAEALEKYVIMK